MKPHYLLCFHGRLSNNTIQVVLTRHHAVLGHSSLSSLIFSDYQHLLLKTVSLLQSQEVFPCLFGEPIWGYSRPFGLVLQNYLTPKQCQQKLTAYLHGCGTNIFTATSAGNQTDPWRNLLKGITGNQGQSQCSSPELSQHEG